MKCLLLLLLAVAVNAQMPVKYETRLTSSEEVKFQQWKRKYSPKDSGYDYDLRGAFKAGLRPDSHTGHWPDTFKKPWHPTFSIESKYAVGANRPYAGHWQGRRFTPPVHHYPR